MTGWLLDQLPRSMTGNVVVQAFVGAGEHLGDSIRAQLDALEHQLDPDLASPEMLTFLGSWLGFRLERVEDPALRRAMLHALGRWFTQRGTKAALVGLLKTLTGGEVTVIDGGGVFGPGDEVPAENLVVRAELSQLGKMSSAQLEAILATELPIGARLELIVPGSVPGAGGRG